MVAAEDNLTDSMHSDQADDEQYNSSTEQLEGCQPIPLRHDPAAWTQRDHLGRSRLHLTPCTPWADLLIRARRLRPATSRPTFAAAAVNPMLHSSQFVLLPGATRLTPMRPPQT